MFSRRTCSPVASVLKQPTLHVTTETMLSPISTVKRANLARQAGDEAMKGHSSVYVRLTLGDRYSPAWDKQVQYTPTVKRASLSWHCGG